MGVIATVLKHSMEIYSGDSCIARVKRLSSRLVIERDDEATMSIEGNPPSSIGLGLGASLLASMRRRWQGLGNIANCGGDRLGKSRMKRDGLHLRVEPDASAEQRLEMLLLAAASYWDCAAACEAVFDEL